MAEEEKEMPQNPEGPLANESEVATAPEVKTQTPEPVEVKPEKPMFAVSKKQSVLFAGTIFVVLAGLGVYKGYTSRKPAIIEELSKTVVPIGTKSAEPAPIVLSGKVLFTSNRDGDSAIYWRDLAIGKEEKFIENVPGKSDTGPILSPDKKYLVFYSDRDGKRDSYGNLKNKLYIANAATRTVKKISDEQSVYNLKWLPSSGGFVMIQNLYKTGQPSVNNILYYEAVNGELKTLIKNSEFEPYEYNKNAYIGDLAISSNSQRMAFTVSHYNNVAVQGVWIYNFFDGRSWRVSDKNASGVIEFSSDSQKVEFDVYINDGRKRYQVDIDSGSEQEVPLIDKGQHCYNYGEGVGGGGGTACARSDIYFSDGRRKAYVDTRDSKSDIFLSNVDGSNELKLTNTGGVVSIVFGPQEKYIIFSYSKVDDSAVYLLDLARSETPTRLSSTSSSFVAFLP